MKTRYFKSGLLAATAALLFAAANVSCTADDIRVGKGTDEGSFGTIYENNVLLQDANTGKSATVVELLSDTYQTELKLTLTKAPAANLSVKASFDAAYLQTYNAAHGTDYALYPEASVSFADEGLFTLETGALNASLGMTITGSDALEEGKTYLVPVAVSSQDESVTIKSEAGHCVYLVQDVRSLPTCHKGEDLPKGFLFFEVNDVNPLNALSCQLEDGRLIWDVVVLFAANINYDTDAQRPYIKCNPNVQYLLDNNEEFLQPLRKRGIKVLLGLLGNHDQAGLAQLSDIGARDFAAEVARYCEAYNLDGVNYDDEYSDYPDLDNPCFTSPGSEAAARLCYETKKAMPDKLVTVFIWGSMYGTETVDGTDADEWIDVAVANYGGTASPIGNMTLKKCSGCSTEFNLNGGSDLDESRADYMLSEGFGWFMGFALNPEKGFAYQMSRISGVGKLYGSPLKTPTTYYKKNDSKPYDIEN